MNKEPIMQKTYIAPHSEVMNVATQQLLANSPLNGKVDPDPNNAGNGSEAAGREDNTDPSKPGMWDQEW